MENKQFVILPNVSYIKQRDSKSCQAATILMLLRYQDKNVKFNSVKHVYNELSRDGVTSHKSREDLVNRYTKGRFVSRYSNEMVAWNEITKSLRQRIPVIISTNFTPSGHVVLAIGYEIDCNGIRSLIVHDPFGKFDLDPKVRNWDHGKSGNNVKYPFLELSTRVEYQIEEKDGNPTVKYRRLCKISSKSNWQSLSDSQNFIKEFNLAKKKTIILEDWEYLIQSKSVE